MNAQNHDHSDASKRGLFARIRGHFLTGLVFLAPIALTVNFIWWAINYIDGRVLPFIPPKFRPDVLFGLDIPGIGVLVFIFVTIFFGWLTKGLLGRQIMKLVHSIMNQFPVIRPLYNAIKQIAETVFNKSEKTFQYTCMVEYPRKGIYAIGFVSTEAGDEINAISGKELLAVFVPTTPNPTSGFLLYFPRDDVTILDMSTEEAAKLVISAGLVEPEHFTSKDK